MRRNTQITDEEEAAITAALEAKSNAAAVARESGGRWNYARVLRVARRAGIELTAGREAWRNAPITEMEEAAIRRALETEPHAAAVARKSGGAWSYSTVWRVAHRAGIELTAGRKAQSRYHRLPDERRAAVIEARRANPNGCQEDIARTSGVSRATVSRIERGDGRHPGHHPASRGIAL
jgi:transposase